MRVIVIGAGAIGSYFGGRLIEAGAQVSFLVTERHLATLRAGGLHGRSPLGDFDVTAPQVSADAAELEPADLVLVCVKTFQLAEALARLPGLIRAGGVVITLQNGVEAPGRAGELVGIDAVLPATAKIFVTLERPGLVSHAGGPVQLTVGEWDGRRSERLARVRDLFVRAGVDVVVSDQIWTELWLKFLFVVPFGGLGALAGLPIGSLRDHPGLRAQFVELVRESATVARAAGADLPHDVVDTTLAFVDQLPAAATSSLHRDLAAGRASELDAWTGAVTRLGRRHQVLTPLSDLLLATLQARALAHGGTDAPVPVDGTSGRIRIDHLDHLVLTVTDVDTSLEWYRRVLGLTPVTFGAGRKALTFGEQKFNLHQAGRELQPHAQRPTPGSVDLCLISATPLPQVLARLELLAVPVEAGPVERTGARGTITSVYVRDPDANLIELSTYPDSSPGRG
jgi:2-dehydropantoate 2-reductase